MTLSVITTDSTALSAGLPFQLHPNGTNYALLLGQEADGTFRALQSTGGTLDVAGANGSGGGNAAASNTGSAVPAAGDYLAFSTGGTLTGVSAATPLPVGGTFTLAAGGTISLAGTPTVNLGTLGGAATAAGQSAIVEALGSPLQAGGAVSLSGTAAIAGTVAVSSISGNVPVTGTFWQAVQPVSGTISIGGTPTVALSAGGTVTLAGTSPVSVAALPLPAGAATAAMQAEIVSALGSPMQAGGAVSISGTPTVAFAAGSAVALGAGSSTIGTVALASGGTVAITTAAGNSVGTTGVTAFTIQGAGTGVPVPVSAAALPLPAGAATAANQTATQGVIGAATAPLSMSAVGAVYNSTPLTLATGQSAALQCDASGYLYVHPSGGTQAVSIVPQSSNGFSWARAINTVTSAMATNVKTSAGTVFAIDVTNGGTGTIYFRLYNLSAAPTVGSATGIVLTKAIVAGGSYTFSSDMGIQLNTGIGYDVTTGSLADTDTTVIATASTVSVTIGYK